MPSVKRESMEFDVVIVGAGPAGLSAACRLRQLALQTPNSAFAYSKKPPISVAISLRVLSLKPAHWTNSSPTGKT